MAIASAPATILVYPLSSGDEVHLAVQLYIVFALGPPALDITVDLIDRVPSVHRHGLGAGRRRSVHGHRHILVAHLVVVLGGLIRPVHIGQAAIGDLRLLEVGLGIVGAGIVVIPRTAGSEIDRLPLGEARPLLVQVRLMLGTGERVIIVVKRHREPLERRVPIGPGQIQGLGGAQPLVGGGGQGAGHDVRIGTVRRRGRQPGIALDEDRLIPLRRQRAGDQQARPDARRQRQSRGPSPAPVAASFHNSFSLLARDTERLPLRREAALSGLPPGCRPP